MYTLQELLRDACNDSGEVNFRHNYSGRGMYGRECVGITGDMDDCMAVIGEVIKQQREEPGFDDAVDTLLNFSKDSMGRDVILYWSDLESIEPQKGIGELYEDGCCPDCGEEIPADAVDGSACSNCGHVFREVGDYYDSAGELSSHEDYSPPKM